MHKTLSVLGLLFGLALIGAAIAQVVDYPQWNYWVPSAEGDSVSMAGKWQRFFLYGLAPLFAGLLVTLYSIYHLKRDKKSSGSATQPTLGLAASSEDM